MDKRTVDTEVESPSGKRALFADLDTPVFYCAHPNCTETTSVPGTFCIPHRRRCADCSCVLSIIPELNYGCDLNIQQYAPEPVVYCAACIKQHNPAAQLPCGPFCTHFKSPVAVLRCRIGATGQLPHSVEAVCYNIRCECCGRSVVWRSSNHHRFLGLVGGARLCGFCLGVNFVLDCKCTAAVGGMCVCTAHPVVRTETGTRTDHELGACCLCDKWVNRDGCKDSEGVWKHYACVSVDE